MNLINYCVSGISSMAPEAPKKMAVLIYDTKDLFLETQPLVELFDIKSKKGDFKNIFNLLSQKQKELVYGKIWELGKLEDCRISGDRWGEENALKDSGRLLKALHRLGLLENKGLCRMPCLALPPGSGGLEPQYFSLGEKIDQDPKMGEIGLVNGIR